MKCNGLKGRIQIGIDLIQELGCCKRYWFALSLPFSFTLHSSLQKLECCRMQWYAVLRTVWNPVQTSGVLLGPRFVLLGSSFAWATSGSSRILSCSCVALVDSLRWDNNPNKIIHDKIYKTNIIGCTQNNRGANIGGAPVAIG